MVSNVGVSDFGFSDDAVVHDRDNCAHLMSEALDEALERLHHWGPEWHERLSNHGPMVVESMIRHGHATAAGRWLDNYETKLDPMPTASRRIPADDWRSALGDPARLGDWLGFFDNQLADASWQQVLARWWPELLPGLAASATHSVIRLGHVVRTLRIDGESEFRLQEFAQSLAYWAGRWMPVPGRVRTDAGADLAVALTRLPALGIRGAFPDLLQQLGTSDLWPQCASVRVSDTPDEVEQQLKALVTAATLHYGSHGQQNPIMLVHAATAPNAVLRILPSLPRELWASSLHAAWTASAAITTIYNPKDLPPDQAHLEKLHPQEVFDRAVEHGDEHVIKLADTALDSYGWHHDQGALDAAFSACSFVERD